MEWWIWVLIIVGAVAVLVGIGAVVDLVRRKRLRRIYEKQMQPKIKWSRPIKPIYLSEDLEKVNLRALKLSMEPKDKSDPAPIKKYSLTVAGAKITFALAIWGAKQAFPGAGKIIDSSITRRANDKYRAVVKADAETIAKIKAEIPTSELYRIIVGKKTVVVDGEEKDVEVESAVEVGFDKKTLYLDVEPC